MKIRFKKLSPEAQTPFHGSELAAGWDLTAISLEDGGNGVVTYRTGLAVEIPENHAGLLFPRSSIYRRGQILTNCVGVIDADYRGEIRFMFKRLGDGERYSPGERIGQLVVVPVPQVEWEEVQELSETERGMNGYGSTGR